MATPPKPIDTSTRLAVDRTRLAYERSVEAWIRTAVSLISFGFTIYKFFAFEEGQSVAAEKEHLLSPRMFGMIMIGTGLVALVVSTIDNGRKLKALEAEFGISEPSPARVIAWVVTAMGLLAFGTALVRG